MRERLVNGAKIRFVAAEPSSCPTLTKGLYAYDFGDTAGLTPLVKMDTLGHTFMPPSIHAGGLRYHGMAPLISQLHRGGYIEAVAHLQTGVFEAAIQFANAEGIVPAPESAHAIRSAIDEALAAKAAGERRVILFNLSGHGFLDLGAYEQYLNGELEDYEYPANRIEEALAGIPQAPVY
jgi:tryptophan synthase beta chain